MSVELGFLEGVSLHLEAQGLSRQSGSVSWASISSAGRRAHKATVILTTSLSGSAVFQRAVSKATKAASGWLLAAPG